ncbi:hypothetical protein [Poseidonibacter ostreae]|uniref:Uncharacterized protein n=1 Tax=Poseidonibacter ostreae TaxID=2654171 RepID=A0A6L4WX94_9BACT|nr:hypothetical protein [Poseidonibacter ostreae]KAB7891373.1 hypothetical protein GBG19_00625 [Poseidonibacter ostreae]
MQYIILGSKSVHNTLKEVETKRKPNDIVMVNQHNNLTFLANTKKGEIFLHESEFKRALNMFKSFKIVKQLNIGFDSLNYDKDELLRSMEEHERTFQINPKYLVSDEEYHNLIKY